VPSIKHAENRCGIATVGLGFKISQVRKISQRPPQQSVDTATPPSEAASEACQEFGVLQREKHSGEFISTASVGCESMRFGRQSEAIFP
jgi:hypothetical protein